MNPWVFLAGVALGGLLTSMSFLFDAIRRRNRAWVNEAAVLSFERTVAATELRRCHVVKGNDACWYCTTHFTMWFEAGLCPEAPAPDPTRDRVQP